MAVLFYQIEHRRFVLQSTVFSLEKYNLLPVCNLKMKQMRLRAKSSSIKQVTKRVKFSGVDLFLANCSCLQMCNGQAV